MNGIEYAKEAPSKLHRIQITSLQQNTVKLVGVGVVYPFGTLNIFGSNRQIREYQKFGLIVTVIDSFITVGDSEEEIKECLQQSYTVS